MTPKVPRASDQEDLLTAIRAANRALDDLLRRSVAGFDLLPAEYRALARIARNEVDRPITLSRSLGITPAATTDLLDRLEGRGWLRRVPNPGDRRSFLLEITPRGLRKFAAARRAYRTALLRSSGGMTPEGRGALLRGLVEFQRVLVAARAR